jgi:hypothetical protein
MHTAKIPISIERRDVYHREEKEPYNKNERRKRKKNLIRTCSRI